MNPKNILLIAVVALAAVIVAKKIPKLKDML
jgi:hypothetical protein